MRLVLHINHCTFRFRVQTGDYWCTVDTELVQDEFFNGGRKPHRFPCQVNCHIMNDESISMDELWKLKDSLDDLFAGVTVTEDPYVVESVIGISYDPSEVYRCDSTLNGEHIKEYIKTDPSMTFKINMAAPFDASMVNTYIHLEFDSVQTDSSRQQIRLELLPAR